MKPGPSRVPLNVRFWRHVAVSAGCWIWSGTKNKKGYGKISQGGFGSPMLYAHRVSFEIHHRSLVTGEMVLHGCDNPSCVNPGHLFAGTSQDNHDDCASKNRRPLGSSRAFAKLTEQDVVTIKACLRSGVGQDSLAKDFSVSQGLISRIKRGLLWRHV